MELTELSLAPNLSCSSHEIKLKSCSNNTSSSSSSSHHHHGHSTFTKKRKFFPDQLLKSPPPSKTHTSLVDLQVSDPLPQDWEQFLDLQSGRMYYFNRKTLMKSWSRPKDDNYQKLDLELNISNSTSTTSPRRRRGSSIEDATTGHCKDTANSPSSSSSTSSSTSGSTTNMVALACLNCHLLVILSKSSPSCPNCKYVHSLSQPSSSSTFKALPTLSLLN